MALLLLLSSSLLWYRYNYYYYYNIVSTPRPRWLRRPTRDEQYFPIDFDTVQASPSSSLQFQYYYIIIFRELFNSYLPRDRRYVIRMTLYYYYCNYCFANKHHHDYYRDRCLVYPLKLKARAPIWIVIIIIVFELFFSIFWISVLQIFTDFNSTNKYGMQKKPTMRLINENLKVLLNYKCQ